MMCFVKFNKVTIHSTVFLNWINHFNSFHLILKYKTLCLIPTKNPNKNKRQYFRLRWITLICINLSLIAFNPLCWLKNNSSGQTWCTIHFRMGLNDSSLEGWMLYVNGKWWSAAHWISTWAVSIYLLFINIVHNTISTYKI